MLTAIGLAAVVMLLLGIPIWMIFLLLAMAGMAWKGVGLELVAQGLTGSVNKLVLLSVPGFIFAGAVMGQGGMSRRLIAWVSSLLGPVPGGLPLTTVGSAEVFGAISGSSSATVAALGKILYPALLTRGYGERFSLGLITSSGAIAMVIPPSIAMILFSVMTNASVGRLFLAGVLPGIVIGICAAVYCIWYSIANKITSGQGWKLDEILLRSRDVLWTLGAPALIFIGIYGGLMTPTEASMAASVYAVFVSLYIYRELTWKQLWIITLETANLTAKVFIIVGASGVFSWILAAEQVPQKMVALITSLSVSPAMVLLLINLILLVVGMFMDPNSAIVLFAPLLWPIAQHAGVDLIHFGIIFTVNLAIGMFTPPFGLNIFVGCSVFKVPSSRVIIGLLPFIIVNLIALGIITYIPRISLVLPDMLMM